MLIPAASTPGIERIVASSSSKNAALAVADDRSRGSSIRSTVSTDPARNPGSTCWTRTRLWTSSAAAISSTSDKATSAATKACRTSCRGPPTEPRSASRNDPCSQAVLSPIAGAMPKNQP